MLEISLLGSPHFRQENQTVLVDLTKRETGLLVYLIAHQRPVSRSLIGEMFWGDRPEEQVRSNLRTLLTRSRKKLGELVDIRRDTIAFNLETAHRLDIVEFQRHLNIANQSWYQETFPSTAARKRLEAGIDLYQGDFLAGFNLPGASAYMDWVAVERDSFLQEVVNALRKLVSFYVGVKDYRMGLEKIEELLKYDPEDEYAHQLKMSILALQGQKNLALNHFSTYARRLEKELQLKTGDQLLRTQQQIAAGKVPDIERIVLNELGDLHKMTLLKQKKTAFEPPPTTPLIGRKSELAELLRAIDHRGYRLVTITGPGGIGKTHLALAAANQQKREYLDGVVFVPLGGILGDLLVTDNDDQRRRGIQERLITGIANALNLTFRGKGSTVSQLVSFLRNKEILMILDNFEHMLDSTPLISELLARVPDISFLVTSREQLYLEGEKVIRLLEFPLPSEKDLDFTRYAQDDRYVSIYLFTERAKRVFPRFELDGDTIVPVARICRLVGGVPLAIELAATWVGHFTCREIADAIEKNIHFLTASSQDRPERHQSIQTVFNYSWDMLTGEEKNIFLQLAVFSGSFSRRAVEAITNAPLSILVSLVNKSMLRLEQMGYYEIHPLLRLFAHEKLDDPENKSLFGSRSVLELAYGRYFLNFVQEHSESLHGINPEQAILTMKDNLENITHAWQLMLEAFQFELVLKSIEGLSRFYHFSGLYHEAILTFTQTREYIMAKLSEIPEEEQNFANLVLARVQGKAAYFYNRLADFESAVQFSQYAIGLAQDCGDQYAETEGLINWGEGVELQGPLDFPRQMYTTALVIAEEINNLRLTARCLKCLGRVAWREGDIAAAESYYERSMEIEQRRGDQIAEGQILVRLGLNAEYEGHIDRALAFFQKAEEIYRRVSHSYRLAGVFLNLGHVHFIMDNYENAKELNQRALEIFQDTNDRHNEAAVRQALGIVQLYETDLAAARQSFSVGLSLSQDILDRRNSSRAYYGLGLVDHYEGNYISAEENFNHALTISIEIDDPMTTGLVNRALGLNCWMVGQYQAAEEYLTRALKGQSSMMDQAHSLADMVLVLGSQKKFAEALDTAEKGLALAGELGQRLVRGILYCRTGNIYLSLLENDKAKEYFLKGLAIFNEVNAKHFSAEANAGLAYLHLVEGEHGLALEWVNGLLKDFPGGRVPGIHSPLWLMGLAYQILKLHIDPRQETVWETLRIGVSDLAGQTGGETARKNIAARLSAYNMAGILEVPWENLIMERNRV